MGAAALVGAPALGAVAPAPTIPRRTLGKTGASIPILLMGGAIQLDRRFDPRLAEAARLGVNVIDTAEAYGGGNSEIAVGNFLARSKARDRVWITTKSGEHQPTGMRKGLLRSLERLKTDHVEMLYLHALTDADYLTGELEKMVATLKREGHIKHFGFSSHHGGVAELMQKAAKLPWIDSIMFRYNFREYGNVALNRAIDACARANIGLIAMKIARPLGARTVWVDSIANAECMSMAGRLARGSAHLWLTQWEHLANDGDGPAFLGSVV